MNSDETRNFSFLQGSADDLHEPASAAEVLFHLNPKACLSRLRVFGEKLAKRIAEQEDALAARRADRQYDRISALEEQDTVPRRVTSALHEIRQAGNKALHDDEGGIDEAETQLRNAWRVARWYGRENELSSMPSSFSPPPKPSANSSAEEEDETVAELRHRIRQLESRIVSATAEKETAPDQDHQQERIEQLEQQLSTFKEQLQKERQEPEPRDASSSHDPQQSTESTSTRVGAGLRRTGDAIRTRTEAAISKLRSGLRWFFAGLRRWTARLLRTALMVAGIGVVIFYMPTLYTTGFSILPEKGKASLPSPDEVRSTHRSLLTEERRKQIRSAFVSGSRTIAEGARSLTGAVQQKWEVYFGHELDAQE